MAGVVDSGYRGEVKVVMTNLTGQSHTFEVGDKIAQMLIQKIYQPKIVEADSLEEADRGGAGFGSTGK